MSKENSENTSNFKNYKDGKHESSDSDDLDERPNEVFRKVLSENLNSPITTPTRRLSPVPRKSSSPKTNTTALNFQRQSASSSYADKISANAKVSESASEQINNSSTSVVIGPSTSESSTINSRTLGACDSEDNSSTKRTKITETSEPFTYTAVKVLVPSNTSDPQDSPLVFLSSTGYEEEISSSPGQNDELGNFAADVLLSDSSLKQVPSSAESEDSLEACDSEGNASNKRTKMTEISEHSAYTAVKVIVPSNTSDPKDSPLVFVSSTGHEEEISSSPEQNDQLGDFAANVLLSDSSSKRVPSSAESEDSDDVGIYEFQNQSTSQQFTTPEALEEEIRSVFGMISSYVNTEMNRTRTKRETLQINLSRRRAFVGYPLSQTLGQFSAVSQRIASQLLSTLTEQEGLEFTYQGPPRTNDQLSFRRLNQESGQCFSHQSFGASSRGPYGACCQQSSEELAQEPSEEIVQAFYGRLVHASSRGLAQAPSRLAPSSSGRFAEESFGGLTSSSRGLPSPSGGLAPSSSGGLAPSSSGAVANLDLSGGSELLSELPQISRLFSRGYSIGLDIGSENYAQRVSVRALQSRFGQMIQDLQQQPELQTQGIPQELFDLASRMIFLLSPRTTHWLNASVPRNITQAYFIGLIVGFSLAYAEWSGRRQILYLSSTSVPRLFHGLSPNLHRDLFLMTERSLQGFPFGPHRGFPHRSIRGFLNRPIRRFSRGNSQSLLRGLARRPIRESVRGHGSDSRSTPSFSRSILPRPNRQEGPANMQERIHILLTQLVLDVNMIRGLADLISREYRRSRRDFERISSYLLCFEIMREDYREKESRYAVLEREISNDVQRHRSEAFAIVHIELLIDILEHCISRIQYGALLVRMHERLGEVRNMSNAIRRVARTAMSYEMWTKED